MKNGTHLLVDIKNCKKIKELSDTKVITSFLVKLIKLAKMKAITEPKVMYYEHEDKIESGITGFVIIADSHVSIHTYPLKKSFYLDLFSCKKFNEKEIIKYTNEFFGGKKIKSQLIKR
ncbi:S-adenosylmethionine decarboxylase proenzyme [Candidatus Falkowbacteria bacterium]|jgi:S-adenosylmethionine decarboxylase|nr:S-adenosylmethionine decarboxylase proenzyme [Candidatus Falkowbacteria bacterium]MBT4433317.1 S-adenosylmethionine decarboxylase proenzyme [Candidatus Falkowbacteria bacterium]